MERSARNGPGGRADRRKGRAPNGPDRGPVGGCAGGRASVPITAAICTRDRPEGLRRALESLRRQVPPPDEILVVENAPARPLGAREVLESFPEVVHVFEPAEGLDFARNRALARATHEVVAFLDDDAVAEPGWAGALARAFEGEPSVAVCTGDVRPLCLETEGQRLFEANGGFGRRRERVRLPGDGRRLLGRLPAPRIAWAVSIGCGASFAVRRDIALRLGGFDEALDLGPVLPGGGDHDMVWRALEAGYDVLHEPRALALHEHRRERSEACRQIVGHQKALGALLGKSVRRARGSRRAGVALFLAWRLAKPGFRLFRRLLGRDPLPARTLLDMWVGCWQGLTTYERCVAIARARRGGEV